MRRPPRVVHLRKHAPQPTAPACEPVAVDEKAVAAMFTASVGWVRDRTRDGTLPSFKIGNLRRYSRAAIVEMIDRLAKGAANA